MATIRPMTTADYPAVAAIAHEAASRGLVGRPTWERAGDVAAEVEALPQAAFLVAESDSGAVVGMAGYRLTDSGEAELYGPLVSSEGEGIGAWLGSRIELLAKQAGAVSFSMLIGLTNRGGAAWAEWRGYHLDTESPETLLSWAYPGELAPLAQIGEPRTRPAMGPAHPVVRPAHPVVRPARPEDGERILELLLLAFPAAGATRGRWEEALPQCWAMEENGKTVGFCHLEQPVPFIRVLCIDPAFRRRGYGSLLVATVLTQFWQQADRPVPVKAAVRLDTAAAVGLCRRLGFRREIPVAKWMKTDRDVEVEPGANPQC